MYLDYKKASDKKPRLMDGTMYICTVSSTDDKTIKNLQFDYGYAYKLNVTIPAGELHAFITSKDGFEKLIWAIFPDAIIKRFSKYLDWQQFTSKEYIAIKLTRREPEEFFVVLISPKN